jgi:hypothetical protein
MPVDNEKFNALTEMLEGHEPELEQDPEAASEEVMDLSDLDEAFEALEENSVIDQSQHQRNADALFPDNMRHEWHERILFKMKRFKSESAHLEKAMKTMIGKVKKHGYGTADLPIKNAFTDAFMAFVAVNEAASRLEALARVHDGD